jgi:hypothetical protein
VLATHTPSPRAPGRPTSAPPRSPPAPVPPAPVPPAPVSGLDRAAVEQVARVLRTAMAGPGTDEAAIYSAFSGRNQTQVDEVAAAYRRLFDRDLQADLVDELTGDELRHLGVFGATAAETVERPSDPELATDLARAVAEQLRAAMDRLGTDEEAVYAALTGRTEAERTAIREQYLALTGRELLADIRSEFSGSELVRATMLFHQSRLQPEDELFLAMAGLGTDEETVFRVIESMAGDRPRIELLERNFHQKYSGEMGELMAALRSDLTTGEYERVLRVLEPVLGDVAFEDCNSAAVRAEIRAFQPAAQAKVDHAIRVLEQGWDGMSVTEKAVFRRFYDPTNTGEIDADFVARVLHNFRLIKMQFGHSLQVECETPGGLCERSRLYYTYGSDVHVCPYFASAPNTPAENTRKARDFVHELAHNAMQAFDRPYYSASRGAYRGRVTPNGPWGTGIPVIGPLIRAISRSDTLYHPDAYSWFAWNV